MIDGTGRHLRSGGRLVKNVTGFDLHRLHAGGRGIFGPIVEASMRLMPAPEAEQYVTSANRQHFERHVEAVTRALEGGPRTVVCLAKSPALQDLNKELKPRGPLFDVTARWMLLAELFPGALRALGVNKLALPRGKVEDKDKDGEEEEDEEEEGSLAPTRVELTHAEAALHLRLSYAITYPSAQGRTIKDRHVVLLDRQQVVGSLGSPFRQEP